jgi:hypothetical protein
MGSPKEEIERSTIKHVHNPLFAKHYQACSTSYQGCKTLLAILLQTI